MAQSVKISDDEFVNGMRETAEVMTRSLGEQALHWLKIGKAIESSSKFNYQYVQEALNAKRSPDELTLEEQEVFFDEFAASMMGEQPEAEAFFEQRRKQGVGVGLDDNDNLIYQSEK